MFIGNYNDLNDLKIRLEIVDFRNSGFLGVLNDIMDKLLVIINGKFWGFSIL